MSSVVASKRKESQFEMYDLYYKLRAKLTNILLMDFGYNTKKRIAPIQKMYALDSYENMSEQQRANFDIYYKRTLGFDEWFILEGRKSILDIMRTIGREIFLANTIYPTCMDELNDRRRHQNNAIGQCYWLVQEMQYVMETLPVDVNKYLYVVQDIENFITKLKNWRKSNNKFKKNFEKEEVKKASK